ncbi:DUF4123 domain-containing protein [Candidatus Thiosymbion oneisti]|uniref:DUF4123 domain-containing protein n=1 Tax=Candidatus Thiosymbion oneisti TaxID=589554 RepID=UPI000AC1E278|nr:DUF4123 domain-containing protein [Candidatus Thiosymbion oneisti]
MSTATRLDTLHRILFENSDQQLYGVLDGASVANLRSLLAQHAVPNVCLLPGDLDPELAQTAPYLVELSPQSPFTKLLLTQGVGNHWGILAHANDDFRTLRMHFRKFLTVWDPDGEPLHFRYYDPRVLRVYLPTCNPEELHVLFGPVTTYFAESDTANVLSRFSFTGDTLGRQQLTL